MSDILKPAGQIITANDLLTGDVIYVTADSGWTRNITDALVLRDEHEASSTLEKAQKQILEILVPYLVAVVFDVNRGVTPVHYREQIRVNGPNMDLRKTQTDPSYVVMGC